MPKIREANYDLLRIISAFAVVVIHISGSFLQYKEAVPKNCTFPLMMLNHIVRFAVPCFLMLSGAFILADERNADYKYFYKKSFKNIGVTSVVFCLLYVLYGIARLVVGVFIFKKHDLDHIFDGLQVILKNLIKGEPFYHLWYLFTLIGLYLAAPFVIRLAADLKRGGVNLYGKITTAFLVFASVSYITGVRTLKWDIGGQLCFLSYFLMGYKLRQWGKTRKNNKIALLLILAGNAINIALSYVNFVRGQNGLPVDVIQLTENPFSYTPLAPIEVIASCLIFSGFSMLKIKKDFSKLAGYTFLIYLIHAGVWDVLSVLLGDSFFENQTMEAAWVVVVSLLVFCISILGAVVYKQIKSKIFRED